MDTDSHIISSALGIISRQDAEPDSGYISQGEFHENKNQLEAQEDDKSGQNVNPSQMTTSQRQILDFERQEANQASTRGMSDSQRDILRSRLRQNVERDNFKGSAWVDHDETGNYDPAEERRRQLLAFKRTKRQKKDHEGTTASASVSGSPGYGNGSTPGLSMILKFPITSPEGLKQITYQHGEDSLRRKDRLTFSGDDEANKTSNDNMFPLRPKKARKIRNQPRMDSKSTIYKQKERKKYYRESRRRQNPHALLPGYKKIKTSFCHPINFNSTSFDSDGSEIAGNCNFCSDRYNAEGLRYSFFGFGEREVVVLELEDGTGNVEQHGGNGYSFEDKDQTQMCQECTWARLSILCCSGHEIRHIAGVDEATFDYDMAYNRMLWLGYQGEEADDPEVKELQAQALSRVDEECIDAKWCSFCPNPAFYECCTTPEIAPDGGEVSPSHDCGCGLVLCEMCAFRVIKVPLSEVAREGKYEYIDGKTRGVKAGRELDDVIRYARDDPINYRQGLRADVSFLMRDGELMIRAEKNFGDGPLGDDEFQGDGPNHGEPIGRENSDQQDEIVVLDHKIKRKWGSAHEIIDLTG